MKIRLTEQEILGMVSALKPFLLNCSAKLYLYGSRVNLNARGGDIDLLILVNFENQSKILKDIKHKMLSEIKNHMGDQKIDLFISSEQALKKDKFLKLIFPQAVLLHEFR